MTEIVIFEVQYDGLSLLIKRTLRGLVIIAEDDREEDRTIHHIITNDELTDLMR